MSTIHYPSDWQKAIDDQETCVPEQVALLKRAYPELYARALRHLEERFSLTEADLQGEDTLLYLLFGSAGEFRRADRLIVEHTVLFRRSVKNALDNLGLDSCEPGLSQMVEMVRRNIGDTFESVETFLEGFHPLEAADEFMEKYAIPANRADALEEMDARFGHVTRGWKESPHVLTDEEMHERFAPRVPAGSRTLTTYFDSAYMGLVDQPLQNRVDQFARQKASQNWPAFLWRMKRRIVRALESKSAAPRRFSPENCFFQPNGTEAFHHFVEARLEPGQRVLATREEYYEIIRKMAHRRIEVVSFSDTEELVRQLDDSFFDYMLVSEVSRIGTVHPLGEFDEARRLLSPQTRFIVDVCQSAGRWQHDLGACHADAVILSTQKGSDLGKGMGVIAVANDFGADGLSDQSGTLPHEEVARTAFSMNPDGLGTISTAQRALFISENMKKFRHLLEAVNKTVGRRIQIISPHADSSEIAGHAMELCVEGVGREEICEHAGQYGIYIADSVVDPRHPESFRIAFHPYMNNDALKILTYVLLNICRGEAELDD